MNSRPRCPASSSPTSICSAPLRFRLRPGYHEREVVKSLGAKWSPAQGFWYISIRDNPEDFAMWLSDDDLERLRELQRRIDDRLHPINAGL